MAHPTKCFNKFHKDFAVHSKLTAYAFGMACEQFHQPTFTCKHRCMIGFADFGMN